MEIFENGHEWDPILSSDQRQQQFTHHLIYLLLHKCMPNDTMIKYELVGHSTTI